jgi:hypothetical protein
MTAARRLRTLAGKIVRRMLSRDVLTKRISKVFDAPYYLATNPDVAHAGIAPLTHYLQHGWTELRDPSPWFSVRWYLRTYPDVDSAGVEPLRHYLIAGAAEGRSPIANFDTIYYSAQNARFLRGSETALEHFLRIGATYGLQTHAANGALQGVTNANHPASPLAIAGWCPSPGFMDLALRTISAHAEAEPDLRDLPLKLERLPVQPLPNAKSDHSWRALFESLRSRPDILVMVGSLDDSIATDFLIHLAEAAPERKILAIAVDEQERSVGLALPDTIDIISLAEFETGEGKALRERLAVAVIWSLRPKVVATIDSAVMREALLRYGGTIRRHMHVILATGSPEPNWAELAGMLGSADLIMAGTTALSEELRLSHAIPRSAISRIWPLRPNGEFDRALLNRSVQED